jgi:hypothetical protein
MKASDWRPSYCFLESWRGYKAILTLENMPVRMKRSGKTSVWFRPISVKVACDTRRLIGDQKSNASAAACEFAPKLATATLISADHNMGAAA